MFRAALGVLEFANSFGLVVFTYGRTDQLLQTVTNHEPCALLEIGPSHLQAPGIFNNTLSLL